MPDTATIVEIVSVVLGMAYVLLAVRRRRACWIFGALSSACLAWLAARSQIPLQAGLQVFYVGMAFYGYRRWSADSDESGLRVGWWSWWKHVAAIAGVLVLSWGSGTWLDASTDAAHPYLDASATWGSLLATWLAARARVENWLYWIVIDLGLALLYAMQDLVYVAGLYAIYLVVAAVGFRAWLRRAAPRTVPVA